MNHSPDQNGSTNTAIKDSTILTIEYLRARLLSERTVSKVTSDRANELANRVVELEKHLKIVSIKKKKAEKATLDLLSVLENREIGEISDEYDSVTGLEESLHDLNVDNGNSAKEKLNSPCSKGKGGSSGLEYKRTNFVQSVTSSRHHLGKSCCQIKRREIKSVVGKSKRKSTSLDAHECGSADDCIHVINGLDLNPEELTYCCENNVEKAQIYAQIIVSSEVEGQVSGVSVSVPKHTCDGEMERALQRQAHLIGCFEAEEKAQREWEAKYMRNGYNIPDSCELGNQSDVTEERDVPEERDETKAPIPSPSELSCHNSKDEPICIGKGTSIIHFDSFKFSPNSTTEPSDNFQVNEVHCCRASASDFAFPVVVNETQVSTDNHLIDSPVQSSLSPSEFHSPYIRSFSSVSSGESYIQEETTPSTRSRECVIIPHEGPQRVSVVLDALQQAKQLLEQRISCTPSKEVRFSTATAEASVPAMWDANRVKMAVEPYSVFRVPADFQFEPSGPQIDYRYYSCAPLMGNNQRLLQSTELRPSSSNLDQFFSSMPTSTESINSRSKPWYGTSFPSSSGFTTYSSNSTHPDVIQRKPYGEPYIIQSPSRSSGMPILDDPTFYNDHNTPNMYRY